MCSDTRYLVILLLALAASCSPYHKLERIRSGNIGVILSVPDEEPLESDDRTDVRIDSIRGELSDGPIIMNAIRDSESGEMIATDIINASRVVARFRNVAEREGYVSINFDVIVPSEMTDSDWQMKIYPMMWDMSDTLYLEPVFITGERYRAGQLRGYQRYKNFMSRIIEDSADLVWLRQLEVFLQRNYPETYAMKTDSSLVSDPVAENIFGVSQAAALRHYTRRLKMKRNERRKSMKGLMYEKYVKDPILSEGVRLDTVITSEDGMFVYRYEHTFKSRKGLRKVMITLDGEMYEDGRCICRLPFPDDLTFYISSLSSMADMTPKYTMMVLERTVYDNTKAFIDFNQGSSEIDTLLSDNASELRRVLKCVDDVVGRKEYVLDSLVIIASCSPEGNYAYNARLSMARSESVKEYLRKYVPKEWRDSLKASSIPENWEQLIRIMANDTILDKRTVNHVLGVSGNLKGNEDKLETGFLKLPGYRYMREKIYPKLRTVSFDFYLHRAGIQKDTVHTTELDSVYMSGLEALSNLDYKKAVSILRPYGDYNSALAYMAAGYNHSALDILDRLDEDARVCYLKAMLFSRVGMLDEAMKYFELSIAQDPYLEHRANLDPEMFQLVKNKQNHFNTNSYE